MNMIIRVINIMRSNMDLTVLALPDNLKIVVFTDANHAYQFFVDYGCV